MPSSLSVCPAEEDSLSESEQLVVRCGCGDLHLFVHGGHAVGRVGVKNACWAADRMPSAKHLEEANAALTQWLSPEHCGHLVSAVISKYIALTPEELEEWQVHLLCCSCESIACTTQPMIEGGRHDVYAAAKKLLHAQIIQTLTHVVHHTQIKVSARCGVQPQGKH